MQYIYITASKLFRLASYNQISIGRTVFALTAGLRFPFIIRGDLRRRWCILNCVGGGGTYQLHGNVSIYPQ